MKVKTVGEMVELAKNLDHFFFVADISDAEQYGSCVINESGIFKCDKGLERYIDFEEYNQNRL